MDWFDQPAAPVQPPPDATDNAVGHRGHPIRRGVATLLLALGLLAVGGGAVAFAADPSATPAPNATTQPSTGTSPSGTPRANAPQNGTHSGVDCPNMGGSGGSTSPGSSAPSTTAPASSPSAAL